MCPKCNKKSLCGCKSCRKRVKIPTLRSYKYVKGDFIKCPYCRKIFHSDYWESYSFDKLLNLKTLNYE